MKNIIKSACIVIGGSLLMQSCSKFEEINTDPKTANEDQLQVEYSINGAIIGAQMNPDIAERSFVLYWKTAGRQHRQGGISSGSYNDDWSNAYYNGVAGWIGTINLAIDVAEKKIANGSEQLYTKNLLQVARIWRAYLMSEMSDNFGPIAIVASKSVNPDFNNVKDVYYFLLAELKAASEALDENVVNPANLKKLDPAYNYDYKKWKQYANSLRLRLAMRLSEVDPAKAKAEFEAAATNLLITDMGSAFKVQEKAGWDDLTGVMSREWNEQMLSATLNNLYTGLGGVTSDVQLPASMHAAIKPANWMGLRFTDHFSTLTNDPAAGFWMDGLPKVIDPRAYKAFIIPGYFSNPDFCNYPSWTNEAITTKRNLEDASGKAIKELDATNTWNATTSGDWGRKGAQNKVYTFIGSNPRLALKFRNSTSQRIFFAPWETYFLLAEAKERGWATPMTAQAAYEAGIQSSFEYWGVSSYLSTYLNAEGYNRAGTSVSWNHTTEPPASYPMNYKDGYTNAAGTVNIAYPINTLYKNGSVKNDHLTKIITQKFIAQTPWLPLETWNDQRRLGLPFFENPVIENPLLNLPALTKSNYMTSNVKFFPQRIKYPSSLQNRNSNGYKQAVSALNGADEVLTPLWWAKH